MMSVTIYKEDVSINDDFLSTSQYPMAKFFDSLIRTLLY